MPPEYSSSSGSDSHQASLTRSIQLPNATFLETRDMAASYPCYTTSTQPRGVPQSLVSSLEDDLAAPENHVSNSAQFSSHDELRCARSVADPDSLPEAPPDLMTGSQDHLDHYLLQLTGQPLPSTTIPNSHPISQSWSPSVGAVPSPSPPPPASQSPTSPKSQPASQVGCLKLCVCICRNYVLIILCPCYIISIIPPI